MIPQTREEWRRYFFAIAPPPPHDFAPKFRYIKDGVAYEDPPEGDAIGYIQEPAISTQMRWRHTFADRCMAELAIL